MENKINVAELLRKCPEGMELDCTLFSRPLKYSGFEGFQDAYPIRTVAENGEIIWFTKEGCAHNNMYSKCVIFPKGKTSWEGFVPPYPFKDGDICYIRTKSNEHIFIFNCIDEYGIKRYANLTKHGFYKDDVNIVCTEKVIEEFRYATEEEKDRLFKSIKDHGYMWNPEKKCLEKLPRFKNGDVVATNSGTWIGIVEKQESDIAMTTHCVLKDTGDFEAYLEEKGRWCFSRLATEDEKQRLFKVMEDNGYKWDAERKCLVKAPKFKNGDVIVGKERTGSYIAIVKEFTNSNSFTTHMFLTSFGTNIAGLNDSNPRLATEYEKQQLFKILKAKGRKWNPETKTLEELPKFKDGDIVAAPIITTGGVWIGIFKQYEDTTFEAYCSLSSMGRFNFTSSRGHILEGTHLATEKEKEKFFKVIKDKGYMWNQETKTLEKLPEFKDGDVVISNGGEIHLLRTADSSYCAYRVRWEELPKFDSTVTTDIKVLRLATEVEKEILFQIIKDNGYKWNAETKTLEKLVKPKFNVGDKIRNKLTLSCFIIEEIKDNCYYIKYKKNDSRCFIVSFNQEKDFELVSNKFDINTLKPFEQVLARDTINDKWCIQFFEKYNNTQHFPFKCILNEYMQCIPYEGNEHLLDTRDECSDYYKTWE